MERKTYKDGMIDCSYCKGTGTMRPEDDPKCKVCDVGCLCEFCDGHGKVLWVNDIMNKKANQ